MQEKPKRSTASGGVLIRLLDAVTRAGAALSALALCGIVGAFCWEVGARYFMNAPTEWAHDTVTYLLAVVIFLGAPELARIGGHVSISFLIESLSPESQALAGRMSALVGSLVCGAAVWMSWSQTAKQFERGIVTLGTIPIPKWWISGVITLGLALLALQFLRHAVARQER